MARILGPLVGQSIHHARNTKDFADKIKGIQLLDTETITSFDVRALFTSIQAETALQVVKDNYSTIPPRRSALI